METDSNSIDQAAPWLGGRSFDDWKAEYDDRGFIVIPNVLSPAELAAIRTALAPWIDGGKSGRNDFEGFRTNRVYAMLAKSPVFAQLAIHPLALAFAEAELGPTCLLSACLAINLRPGETVQPWHHDDSGGPRPRKAYGVSAFWAIDDTTEMNGATEVIPGSHLWGEVAIDGAIGPANFTDASLREGKGDPGARADAVKLVMPAGSLAIAKGTLCIARRQPLGQAPADHHAAILRRLGAAAGEHGPGRAAGDRRDAAGAGAGADRLFDPSAVHGLCRRGPPQTAAAGGLRRRGWGRRSRRCGPGP